MRASTKFWGYIALFFAGAVIGMNVAESGDEAAGVAVAAICAVIAIVKINALRCPECGGYLLYGEKVSWFPIMMIFYDRCLNCKEKNDRVA